MQPRVRRRARGQSPTIRDPSPQGQASVARLALLARVRPVVVGRPRHPRHGPRTAPVRVVRSGCVAANSAAIAPPSSSANTAARSDPAASITATTSSICSSSVGAPLHGIRQPRAAPVEQRSGARTTPAARSSSRPDRLLPIRSTCEIQLGHVHQVDRALADHLVGDVEIAAARVPGLRRHAGREPTALRSRAHGLRTHTTSSA